MEQFKFILITAILSSILVIAYSIDSNLSDINNNLDYLTQLTKETVYDYSSEETNN